MSDLQVSIVTFNNERTIGDCLLSVLRELGDVGGTAAVDVADNASTDGTVQSVRSGFPDVRIRVFDRNLGFGAAHNRVLEDTPAELVLLLNPDAALQAGALARLQRMLLADDGLALTGPRLESTAGVPEVSFGTFPGVVADLKQSRRVRAVSDGDPEALAQLEAQLGAPFRPDWISGACMLARTEPLRRVGLFDERFFLYLEDVDLCLRLRAADWSVAVEPRARCTHDAGGSQGDREAMKQQFRASRLAYEQKHGTKLGAFLYRGLKIRSTGKAD